MPFGLYYAGSVNHGKATITDLANAFEKGPKTTTMISLYTKKIRQNADLVNPMSKCPFGEPVAECPFLPYYEMKHEREQVAQIEFIPQEKLDEMRHFHRACMHNLMKTRKANFL